MATLAPIGRAAAERAAFREHIKGCTECDAGLAEPGKPLVLCATGEALWAAYQVAKVARRRDALLTITYNEAGDIISVAGLDKVVWAELHNYLGTHVCGCDGPKCGCWQAGYEFAQETVGDWRVRP